MTSPGALLSEQKKQLAFEAYGSVLIPLGAMLLLIWLLFLLPFSAWTAAVMAVLTAAGLSLGYYGWMTKFLPYVRVRRLYSGIDGKKAVPVEGVYRGMKETQRLRDGVRMRVLRVDAGDRVRTEPVEREVCLPSVFTAEPERDERIRLSAAGGVITGIEPGCPIRICLKDGGYRTWRWVYFAFAAASAALWLTVHFAAVKASEPLKTDFAVCTVAYHAESEAALIKAAEQSGLSFAFSYSTTLESEQLSQYLSTYGVFGADLILLPASQFERTFDRDTPRLPASELLEDLKTVPNAAGEPAAVVLYDPSDPVCSARISAITDWIAIPSGEPYLLCFGPDADETAGRAAALLLSVLSDREFFKGTQIN